MALTIDNPEVSRFNCHENGGESETEAILHALAEREQRLVLKGEPAKAETPDERHAAGSIS